MSTSPETHASSSTTSERPNNALLYYNLSIRALIEQAEKDGVIITVERKSVEPLAMRNTIPVIDVRLKR